jgi:2-polyprenyl-3-methyl-5-hydroxy-6-metoxy-1,4-benzoquinol methylase
MERNTAQLWDRAWDSPVTIEEDIFNLLKEENCIRWQRIEEIALKEFGSFNNLKVIEVGAGAGINAALMAKRGAKVTILDYSETALNRAREFFTRNGLSAEFIKQDALSLSADFIGKYDIAMSFGLTEHFAGSKRVNINKAHFDLLRKGGIAFISVPYRYSPPFRIYKFAARSIGIWGVGEDYPYSKKELRNICRQIGITEYSFFFADSLCTAFDMINPFKLIRRSLKLKKIFDVSRLKKEKSTFLDRYLSPSLVLYGKK